MDCETLILMQGRGSCTKQGVSCGIQGKTAVVYVQRRFRKRGIRGACKEHGWLCSTVTLGSAFPGFLPLQSQPTLDPGSRKKTWSVLNTCRHSFLSSFCKQYRITTFPMAFVLD